MNYVKIQDGQPIETDLRSLSMDLRKSGTSPPDFPSITDKALLTDRLADHDVQPLIVEPTPKIDAARQAVAGHEIVNESGAWVKRAVIRDLSVKEAEAVLRKTDRARKSAMQKDMSEIADPIFMKYQAGEATREEWLAARQLVRDWYANNN